MLYSSIFLALVLVAGLAFAAWRGFVAWRTIKRFQRTTQVSMLQVATLISQLELRTADVTARAARIDTARTQLVGSLATAKVIGDGARELWTMFRLVRSFVPTK